MLLLAVALLAIAFVPTKKTLIIPDCRGKEWFRFQDGDRISLYAREQGEDADLIVESIEVTNGEIIEGTSAISRKMELQVRVTLLQRFKLRGRSNDIRMATLTHRRAP